MSGSNTSCCLSRDSIAPVTRPRSRARDSYDRIAGWYDRIASPYEGPHRRRMVQQLDVQEGESALDIGFGTGDVIVELARLVGPTGTVAGIDISPQMKEVATWKLKREGLLDRTDLRVGDACEMPFEDNVFDAVCASFTLELFTVDDMQTLLGHTRRVLRDDGRLAVASMSTHERTVMARLYVSARRLFPAALDCRPISVEETLEAHHFQVHQSRYSRMAGIPVAVVAASPR